MARLPIQEIGIYELVKSIRNELRKIRGDPETQESPLLSLKNLEMELSVVVSRAGEECLKFYVVTADVKYPKEQTSTIKLTFEPLAVTIGKAEETMVEEEPVLGSQISRQKLRELIESLEAQSKARRNSARPYISNT